MAGRLLSSLARKLLNAPPDSVVGRLVAQLRESARTQMLDARSVSEFDDLGVHERMLADRVRVDAYARAIDRQVRPDDVVLDLGTGTGILAFLASKRARKVYAVDHSPVLDVAQHVAQANGLSNIEFVRANSREFTPPEPISIVLHEQIGDELFEENMIENVVDLRARVLAPGGRILPAKFGLFIEPVMLKDDYSVPFLWQMKLHGLDYSSLRGRPEIARYGRADLRWQHRLEVERLLGAPSPAHQLDLATVQPHELPKRFHVRRTVLEHGRLDGLFVYVAVDFGDGIGFDTSPSTTTSWGNQLYRVPTTPVEAGSTIEFTVDLPDARDVSSWVVNVAQPPLGRVGQ